jgi:hypothetical protein
MLYFVWYLSIFLWRLLLALSTTTVFRSRALSILQMQSYFSVILVQQKNRTVHN